MIDLKKIAHDQAKIAFLAYEAEYNEPMDGDAITDYVAEFEGKLKELNGDNN
jgi:hypothetical protein